MSDKALKRRLVALQKKVDLLQALMAFLQKHPGVVSYCTLKQLSTGTGLNFQEKCIIRPVWDGKATLKLIRYISEFDDDGSETLWHEDVSGLSFDELAALLKDKGQIDLRKPPDWDPEDDEEQTNAPAL
jgi:hypothetical protein